MSVGAIYIADNGRLQKRKIQRELCSLGASRKLVTSQLSAHPLGGAVGEPANSLLIRFCVSLKKV